MRHSTVHHQPLPLFTASICSLIQLERNSNTPLYQQICEKIREAIHSGQLAEGTRLPTERALANAQGVNRTTVMNAYNQLASDGLVEGHVGRGTLAKRNQFNYLDDNIDADGPSWLFGLPTTEREIVGPDARLLSELASIGEDVISLAAGAPSKKPPPPPKLENNLFHGPLPPRRRRRRFFS